MSVRQNALNEWLSTTLNDANFTLTPIAGDASFRRYFRVLHNSTSFIVMDAPPDKETISPFISCSKTLYKGGVHTPQIFATDVAQGFALLEDLGDALFLNTVSSNNANLLYTTALNTLLTIQQCQTDDLPIFNHEVMLKELALFPEWFLKQYLSLSLTSAEESIIDEAFHWLTTEISQQPYVFMHRDYHSRNLIVTDPKTCVNLGVIDFQDAMKGPLTYDLVSLLKDCYIQWPREQITKWLNFFYEQLPQRNQINITEFQHGFELCGLQRHLKVLGIFCRLNLRDNKPQYLRDLPLTFHYVLACLENQKELHAFYQFMQQRVYQPFITASQS